MIEKKKKNWAFEVSTKIWLKYLKFCCSNFRLIWKERKIWAFEESTKIWLLWIWVLKEVTKKKIIFLIHFCNSNLHLNSSNSTSSLMEKSWKGVFSLVTVLILVLLNHYSYYYYYCCLCCCLCCCCSIFAVQTWRVTFVSWIFLYQQILCTNLIALVFLKCQHSLLVSTVPFLFFFFTIFFFVVNILEQTFARSICVSSSYFLNIESESPYHSSISFFYFIFKEFAILRFQKNDQWKKKSVDYKKKMKKKRFYPTKGLFVSEKHNVSHHCLMNELLNFSLKSPIFEFNAGDFFELDKD